MKRLGGLLLSAGLAFAQEPSRSVPLVVPAGATLRLYLTKRIPRRLNAPVQAKLLVPVYAFDREVIPAGTEVFGTVARLQNVPTGDRTKAVMSGDFTPLHLAEVRFTSMRLADGRQIAIDTVESVELNSQVPLKPPKPRKQKGNTQNDGTVSTGKQVVKDQVDARISTLRSIPDVVRGPDKKDMLADFFWAKLPYHPQFVHSRTRFDAELRSSLDFGSVSVTQNSLALLGSQPSGESTVRARLVTPVDSKISAPGQPVRAVLDEPLFSSNHQLVLPEGTQLQGTVVLAKQAGWFHHAGRLRFTFEQIELSPEALALLAPAPGIPGPAVPAEERTLQFRTQATLKAGESGGAPVKVDDEGGVQATESKTRFVGLALAAAVATHSGLGDSKTNSNGVTTQGRNTGGRLLGGGSGFGLVGTIAGQLSANTSLGLGYYGLARSVYFGVVARGPQAEFLKNAVVDIGFDVRKPVEDTKVKSDAADRN
ncbi:MAG: hypothetical protein JWO80_2880 [Bryobacterales bacterium]|nr:hypothetical protein [Bryobacterales bacterium]